MPSPRIVLDTERRSEDVLELEDKLRHWVVGQEEAVKRICETMQVFYAGLQATNRPLATLLFLGPTGSGKTRVVEALADCLFGTTRAFLKVDCAEFQADHEIAKLMGSPPGYLGHRDTKPLLAQENLDQWQTDKCKLNLLLFDEVEKASDSLWQLLLGVTDKGICTLGDNHKTNFSRTVIFMTSNLGANRMAQLTGHTAIGYGAQDYSLDDLDSKLKKIALQAARKRFSPEFINRIDQTVIFHTLRPEHLRSIVLLELGAVQQRILNSEGNHQFVFRATPAVYEHLLENGFSVSYGARELKRLIEREIVFPLSNLVATGQLGQADLVEIDYVADHFRFTKIPNGALAEALKQYADFRTPCDDIS